MPVSQFSSSSASSSSFPHVFSHTTSSSSFSSPSSSPESSLQGAPAPYNLSKVPFIWEESPGVLKKGMQMSGVLVQDASGGGHGSFWASAGYGEVEESPSPSLLLRLDGSSSREKVVQQMRPPEEPNIHPSKKHGRSKVLAGETLPRLRPPPRLAQPEHAHFEVSEDARRHSRDLHGSRRASTQVFTGISSLSLNKRSHQRSSPLEDDPFWVAMVACTNESTSNGWRRQNCSKVFEGSGNSCLPKSKRQGDIYGLHLEQCLPEHSMPRSAMIRLEKAHCSTTPSIKDDDHDGNVTNKHGTADHALHDLIGDPRVAARKALRALSFAKAGLHDRCKTLLRQQSAPPDMSATTCDSSKKMKKKLPIPTPKPKLPDLFGCRSMDLPLSNRPPTASPR